MLHCVEDDLEQMQLYFHDLKSNTFKNGDAIHRRVLEANVTSFHFFAIELIECSLAFFLHNQSVHRSLAECWHLPWTSLLSHMMVIRNGKSSGRCFRPLRDPFSRYGR